MKKRYLTQEQRRLLMLKQIELQNRIYARIRETNGKSQPHAK